MVSSSLTSEHFVPPSRRHLNKYERMLKKFDPDDVGLGMVIMSHCREQFGSLNIGELGSSIENLFTFGPNGIPRNHPILGPAIESPVERMILIQTQQRWKENMLKKLEGKVKDASSLSLMVDIAVCSGVVGFLLGQYIAEETSKTNNAPAQVEQLTDEQVEILRVQREKYIQQN